MEWWCEMSRKLTSDNGCLAHTMIDVVRLINIKVFFVLSPWHKLLNVTSKKSRKKNSGKMANVCREIFN